ncbi:MAG: transcriptional repressor LexA [Clostridia bacterium]|nr:transcriptional repressor LexA [Clostridia bacterium]
MEQLKPKEKRVLDYINLAIERNGMAPSVREICASLGIKSTSTAHMYVERLASKGYIKKLPGKSRTIRKAEDETKDVKYKVPLIGQVAAGAPILAQENFEGYITYSSERRYDPEKLFCLKVKGESMKEIGIMDGDYVIVEQTSYAENGEIVVALVEDEATVKRFFKENGVFRLQPENKDMEPIIVKDVSVLGKVVALVRYYA